MQNLQPLDQAPLEGLLLKEGRKNKKAWKKRLLKQSENTLNYSKEKAGKHIKGSIDLQAMVGVQATEEKITLDKVQYFIFEIELKESTLRFGASDRLQLDYWLDGLRAILRKNGAVVSLTSLFIFRFFLFFFLSFGCALFFCFFDMKLGSTFNWRNYGSCYRQHFTTFLSRYPRKPEQFFNRGPC